MKVPVILLAAAVAMVVPAEGGLRLKASTLQRRKPTLLGAASDTTTADCGGQTRSCVGCSSVLQCTRLGNIYRPISTTACPVATPYCSAGTCVADLPDDSCIAPPTPSSAFTCNGDGYFPDPSNCRRYWMCVGGKAYQYNCNDYAGTVYSQRRAMCVPSSEVTCTTVACSNALVGVYQRYAADAEVYVVCTDAVAANALVATCPPNYAVDTATGDCVLTCLAEGRLPDRDNNTRYYECIQTGTNTYSQPLLLMCPVGSTFSAEQQRCLTGNENNNSGNTGEKGYNEDYYAPDASVPESQYDVPSTLKIGAASAAYQVEGAWNFSDKGLSIQDVFYHSRPSMANGDVADDSFNKYLDDISMLEQLQLQYYRFSISWPRLLPSGDSSNPSAVGTQYYNALIDGLIAKGIEPVITLYHWDLPQTYQNDGGWLNSQVQERFVDYATYCFQTFGDRVKTWILFNEPMSQCLYGYEGGYLAPAVTLPGTGAYLCSHNMVLAAAKAYRAYQENFSYQNGLVGNAISIKFAEPETSSQADIDAAERYNVWQYAWFADPLYFGDYPSVMRTTVDQLSAQEGRTDSRLPRFTAEEKQILTGAMDFLGLNNYVAILASAPSASTSDPASPSFNTDYQATLRVDPNWTTTARDSFQVTPFGLADSVRWVSGRYDNFPIWVTENGYAGAKDEGTRDQKRIGFYSGYMRGLMQAINRDNCNVLGYTAWSLEDNLEWNDGYDLKFGLVYVDFNDPERPRTMKDSGAFFQTVMTTRHVPYVERS